MRCPWGQGQSEFDRLFAIETDDCVVWPYGRIGEGGYGWVQYDGAGFTTHVLALTLFSGPKTNPDHQALHSCKKNKGCMNKRHLRWGTSQDNSDDMIADGHGLKGVNVPGAKLNDQSAAMIYVDTRPYEEIAFEYNTSISNVSLIKNDKRWTHVTHDLTPAKYSKGYKGPRRFQ